MLRRSQTITATALALLCVAAPTAGASIGFTAETVPPPPSSIAQSDEKAYQDLRSPDAVKAPFTLNRDYGSPDAVDAARDLPPSEIPAPVVDVDAPAGGFDWGDAGIGAAGMLALFGIAGGSALLLSGRKRRHGVRVAH
jgi:hypothetical protein